MASPAVQRLRPVQLAEFSDSAPSIAFDVRRFELPRVVFLASRHRKGVTDLFGQVPVTWPEVYEWVDVMVGLKPTSWRFEYYIRGWRVIERIIEAKLDGTFYLKLRGELGRYRGAS